MNHYQKILIEAKNKVLIDKIPFYNYQIEEEKEQANNKMYQWIQNYQNQPPPLIPASSSILHNNFKNLDQSYFETKYYQAKQQLTHLKQQYDNLNNTLKKKQEYWASQRSILLKNNQIDHKIYENNEKNQEIREMYDKIQSFTLENEFLHKQLVQYKQKYEWAQEQITKYKKQKQRKIKNLNLNSHFEQKYKIYPKVSHLKSEFGVQCLTYQPIKQIVKSFVNKIRQEKMNKNIQHIIESFCIQLLLLQCKNEQLIKDKDRQIKVQFTCRTQPLQDNQSRGSASPFRFLKSQLKKRSTSRKKIFRNKESDE